MTGWHVDKRLSIGHIITTLVVAVSAVGWLYNVDGRTRSNEQQLQQLTQLVESHAELDAHHGQLVARARTDAKLDAIIERLDRLDARLRRIEESR